MNTFTALFKLLFNFQIHDPPCFLLLTLELKGLSLIHVDNYESGSQDQLHL